MTDLIDNPVPPVQTDYLAVAKAALTRGFAVTPLVPGAKAGVLYRWNVHPATTVSEVIQHSKDFPHHDVGIVSTGRGIGHLMFFDDDAGVATRIEAETGMKLPTLCVVQTRPRSAPFKKHFYFRQTVYSLANLPNVQTNVKDFSLPLTERGVHPTVYDLKAIGRAGLVVAPGSVRVGYDGAPEYYTTDGYWTFDDVPSIPDWLVNWFRDDVHRFLSEKGTKAAKGSREKAKQKSAEKVGDFEIAAPDTHSFIRSRACSFARLGVEREDIEALLPKQVIKFCGGGRELAASEKGKSKFYRAAHDPKVEINRHAYPPKRRETYVTDGTLVTPIPLPPAEGAYELLVPVVQSFSDRILVSEAVACFKQALKGTAYEGYALGDTSSGWRHMKKLRRTSDFEPENEPGGHGAWWWVRAF
jgi:bifunctional DNA primase/polymerase-like protein